MNYVRNTNVFCLFAIKNRFLIKIGCEMFVRIIKFCTFAQT